MISLMVQIRKQKLRESASSCECSQYKGGTRERAQPDRLAQSRCPSSCVADWCRGQGQRVKLEG